MRFHAALRQPVGHLGPAQEEHVTFLAVWLGLRVGLILDVNAVCLLFEKLICWILDFTPLIIIVELLFSFTFDLGYEFLLHGLVWYGGHEGTPVILISPAVEFSDLVDG